MMGAPDLFWIVVLSAILVVLLCAPGLKTGINLADEGYLWHGVIRVLEGAVPIRDFRAYDPGRYYWCAMWMRFMGRDLVSLRITMLATQILALAMGVSAVHVSTGQWMPTLLASLALVAWMLPRYKQVDIFFPMTAALVAVQLVNNPCASWQVLAGVFAGFCLLFGLNHAIYAGGGLTLLIGIMAFHHHGPAFGESMIWYALGGCIGILPAIAMLIGIPGLRQAYWRQKILKVLRRRTTNLPLPVPWLWRPAPRNLENLDQGTRQTVRAGFTVMPFFYGLALLPAVLTFHPVTPREWAGIAVSCVGVFYMHHAMSRADITHLAQASPPLIIGLITCLSSYEYGWMMVAPLVVVSLLLIYRPHDPSHRPFVNASGSGFEFDKVEIEGNALFLPRDMARYVVRLYDLVETYSKRGDLVLFVPNLVTLYPLFARKSANYDIYCVHPASDEEQSSMIGQLIAAGPHLALVANRAIDTRDELRFSNTHPDVWQYLHREFTVLDIAGNLPDDHHVFIRPRPD